MAGMLAVALVPSFFGLLLGCFAGISKSIDNANARTLANFALPCMLLLAIVLAPRDLLWDRWRVIGYVPSLHSTKVVFP